VRRAPVAAVAALAVLGAVPLAGCKPDHKSDAGRLSWVGKPNVFKARNLPNDRVVIARVKNAGSKTLHLVASKVVVRDANGRALDATAAFNTTFAHGLYGALQQPAAGPPVQELARLGKAIYLSAGGSAPFYAAWRLQPGTKEPVRIEYAGGSLTVPRATATSH
jgi:hypothetical protein